MFLKTEILLHYITYTYNNKSHKFVQRQFQQFLIKQLFYSLIKKKYIYTVNSEQCRIKRKQCFQHLTGGNKKGREENVPEGICVCVCVRFFRKRTFSNLTRTHTHTHIKTQVHGGSGACITLEIKFGIKVHVFRRACTVPTQQYFTLQATNVFTRSVHRSKKKSQHSM